MFIESILMTALTVASPTAEEAMLVEQYRIANTDAFGFPTEVSVLVDDELLEKLASIEASDLD